MSLESADKDDDEDAVDAADGEAAEDHEFDEAKANEIEGGDDEETEED